MQRERELDCREENLRKAEGPFAEQKKELQRREDYMTALEEDIYTREACFMRRMDNGDKEVREMKERTEAELAQAILLREKAEQE